MNKIVSDKVRIDEKGIFANEEVNWEDSLINESPVVTILSDPKAEGKMCPFGMTKMAGPVPCSLGSEALFSNETARDEANKSHHQYEWKLLQEFKKQGLAPLGHLAFRTLVSFNYEDLCKISSNNQEISERLKRGREIFEMNTSNLSKEEFFYGVLLSEYFYECLLKIEYLKKKEDLEFKKLCFKAVIIALRHHVPISFLTRPEDNSALLKLKVFPKVEYAYGLYPSFNKLAFRSVSNDTDDIFVHFVRDVCVVQSIKKIPKDRPISFKLATGSMSVLNDIVAYKCSNPECTLSFPLKEKTNEKVVKCPLEECGKETNIWMKLKRLHELKKEAEVAREIFQGSTGKKTFKESVEILQRVISEFETFLHRPYKGISKMEDEMKKMILMEKFEQEEEWTNQTGSHCNSVLDQCEKEDKK